MLEYLATEGLPIRIHYFFRVYGQTLTPAPCRWQTTGILFCQYTLAQDYQFL